MPSFSKRLKKVFSSSSRTDLRADALAQAEASKGDDAFRNHNSDSRQSSSQSSASTSTATLTQKQDGKTNPVSRSELSIRSDAPPRYEDAIEQPSSQPRISPWTLAFRSLSDEDAALLGHDPSVPLPTSELPSLNTTLSALQDAISKSLEARWRVTLPTGRTIIVRDLLEKLLLRVNTYLSIGNIMVQSDPGVAALVWGVVRFLVQVGINQVEVYANLVKSLDGIVGLCARGRVYEGFYHAGEKESARKVLKDLEGVYGLVLRYLAKCVYFFKNEAGKLKFGEPWAVKFGPLLDEIRSAEHNLELDARLAGEEDQRVRDEKIMGLLMDTQGCLEGVILPLLDVVKQRVDTLVDEMEADKQSQELEKKVEILKWLGILPYGEWHRAASRSRMDRTGSWVVEKDAFVGWKSERRGTLWMHGAPGVGKTVLSSLIIDELKKDSSLALAYFHCNYDDPSRQDPDLILAMILKQLVAPMPTLPPSLVKLYENHKSEGFASVRPDADELESLLVQALKYSEKDIVILLDALDEIPQPARKRMFSFFSKLKEAEGDNKVLLLVTSRWLADIKTHMSKATQLTIDIKEDDTSADIVLYIDSEVDKAVEEEELLEGEISEDLVEDIKDHLQKQAGGMFLWVRYQIAHLCEQETEYDIQEALTDLPTGLHDTYTRILHKIRAQSASRRRIAERTLRWMLSAARPLTSLEITEATAIEAGDQRYDSRKAPNSVSTILNVCGNLVFYDEALDVVRFSHLSVQEFLKSELGQVQEGQRMGE
ncbi:hypothetical protein BJ508DRAFT_361090 [Ascobolus immersus RN42]|uniref:Uncharacterized protein n=1 Tax=Ascobolus immersus RN42 TaxID=1160509 RepID=A0A3N4IEL8_ASCIM|nr:hypothetical protein BJ508DRAFT_361090 [Ascobolus immersus RN42]